MITNAGLNLLRNWIYGDSVNAITHMGVGTGTAAPQATDTTLEAEVLRKTFSTKAKGSDGVANYEMELLTTEGNGNDLTEVGILNAAAAGDLLNRITHAAIPKTSSFELKYEIEITDRRT